VLVEEQDHEKSLILIVLMGFLFLPADVQTKDIL
jgi:hypothetical protein